MSKKSIHDAATYLFWLFEIAVENGQSKKAAKLAKALNRKGFVVTHIKSSPAKNKGGAR